MNKGFVGVYKCNYCKSYVKTSEFHMCEEKISSIESQDIFNVKQEEHKSLKANLAEGGD